MITKGLHPFSASLRKVSRDFSRSKNNFKNKVKKMTLMKIG